MSRHNRRRRRSRQHRHNNLLADADALESGYEDSSSIATWPTSRLSAPCSANIAYTRLVTQSSTSSAASVCYTPSTTYSAPRFSRLDGSSTASSASSRFNTTASTSRASTVIYTPLSTDCGYSQCYECTTGAHCRSKVSNDLFLFLGYPEPGLNPWPMQPLMEQSNPLDHPCEYTHTRKETFPPGPSPRTHISPLPIAPGYALLQRTIPCSGKDETVLPHDAHYDSLCNTMTSVIKALFHGEMDYYDDEIELDRAQNVLLKRK